MAGLLEKIKQPSDVKKLSLEEKTELCAEIRSKIINTVSVNGGHLASNLGVVELTVALFSAFNLEKDSIVWDVGHQVYTHKLLTGRCKDFDGIRKMGGISGFPSREESKYDPFTSGHSSASISAALGIAAADELNRNDAYSIAVIGDGSLTGGLAFEGLNNTSRVKKNFIVILNDNEMAISPNVGALAKYLGFIRTKPGYIRVKEGVERVVSRIPVIGGGAAAQIRKTKNHIKNNIYDSTIFDDLGFSYYGPFDGHNLETLIETLKNIKEIHRPVLLHVRTVKGKGYSFAEDNPNVFHGVGKFDVPTGKTPESGSNFSSVFGDKLCELASQDERIVAITAAMASGTGLSDFARRFPKRFFDVGIAEGHAVTFSAGLAVAGKIPVFAVYSTFLQRAYDNMLHDVALQKIKCILAIDRAGFVGEDGRTHHGVFDAAYLRTIPEVTAFSPCYYEELRLFMDKAVNDENLHLTAIRYPRGSEQEVPADFTINAENFCTYGNGKDALLVTYGRIFSECVEAREELKKVGINVSILKLQQIIPLDEKVYDIAKEYENVFFFEEAYRTGGVGEGFISELMQRGFGGKVSLTAIDKGFVEHGPMDELLRLCGLKHEKITEKIKERI